MIKIESLTIKNFRGIKDLTIPILGKSWVIHGRNGSGKSGVVDAIEFALSGEIGRLSGEGRGDVSVKVHGPHVDFKDDPKSAQVEIELKSANFSDKLRIIRDCNNPSKFKTNPVVSGDLLAQVKSFPLGRELVLSRREILKFVLSEPGRRSKEIQALLQISKIDEIRASLLGAKNKVIKAEFAEKQEFERKKQKLREWLTVEELNKDSILCVINKHRANLKLEPIIHLDEFTQIAFGEMQENSKSVDLDKKGIVHELSSLMMIFEDQNGLFSNQATKFLEQYKALSIKTIQLRDLSKLNFYEIGLPLIGDNVCPFCNSEWEDEELQKIIKDKIIEISGLKEIKDNLLISTHAISNYWQSALRDIVNLLNKLSGKLSFKTTEMIKTRQELALISAYLESDFDAYQSLLDIGGIGISNLESLKREIITLKEEVGKLPEKSLKDESKSYLIICQERLTDYWESKQKWVYEHAKLVTTEKMLSTFNTVVEDRLCNLYDEVQKDFSHYYQIVNKEDESTFVGDLSVDKGALEFKVNFYDRGKFPPAAYHSEGHQDSMGLCLYLALMKKILGNNFTLAILDDVLMSVDADHRKSFCKLLKKEFPNTQFIITTHDEYWKKQMVTEGLINHSTILHFKNWTVDTGPSVWDEKDSWEDIDQFIADENIPRASHSLRRFLEYFMDELSVRFSASIPRSASGDHDLGELLSGVTSRYGDLLKKANSAAKSWKNSELSGVYELEKKEFDACLAKARSEMWGMNATVHFNSWANMGTDDFKEIRDAYFSLVQRFKCQQCNTLLHVIPLKGSSESLKCDCGYRNYNLKSK
ncbi:recombination protein F [Legionella steelei]|uniref:Recombination protein F n=1 Tax=Legionella steelei TaxID=947033 RepID=A0A0W0ZRU8_9GAMM|nr:AAA family ATPase [Legionella steelei]KTD71780.1 recombination protein F [Legionella steelei]